jgi:hypothetical protein
MKKIFTLLATLAVAFSLTMPAFAKQGGKEGGTGHHGKAHWLHAKKKGAHKGKKEGQEGSNPGQKEGAENPGQKEGQEGTKK